MNKRGTRDGVMGCGSHPLLQQRRVRHRCGVRGPLAVSRAATLTKLLRIQSMLRTHRALYVLRVLSARRVATVWVPHMLCEHGAAAGVGMRVGGQGRSDAVACVAVRSGDTAWPRACSKSLASLHRARFFCGQAPARTGKRMVCLPRLPRVARFGCLSVPVSTGSMALSRTRGLVPVRSRIPLRLLVQSHWPHLR